MDQHHKYIDLKNLHEFARGDAQKVQKYLNLFLELIPPRIHSLNQHLAESNRHEIRQILHRMSPQLQFFELPKIKQIVLHVEQNFVQLPFHELEQHITEFIQIVEGAVDEVKQYKAVSF